MRRQLYSTMVAEDLKQFIASNAMKPGDRLPTENELCERYSVSRTVVREAVSRLQSEGIVQARQGRGVFVSDFSAGRRFVVDWDLVRTLPTTVHLMQLRLAVEVESAGLCALHRTDEEVSGLRDLLDTIDRSLLERESQPIIYDFAFHLAIAEASRNPYIHNMLKFLEPVVVSRFSLSAQFNKRFTAEYAAVARSEHEAVVRAIERKREADARKTMRVHLTRSIERLVSLAERLREGDEASKAGAPDRPLIRGLWPELG